MQQNLGRGARAVLMANLVAQSAIIVTGALVRLTGSGLGCPTWPECVQGSIAPVEQQAQSWHKYVEFGNRTLTGALLLIAVATFVVVLRHRPRRPSLLLLAAVPFLGTVAQALLGGITVLTGLSPWTVAAHLLVSIALVAAAVVLYVRSGEDGDGPAVPLVAPALRWLARALVVVTFAIIVMGTMVTGSGPHAGDALTPRLALDTRTVAWMHADIVLLFLGLTIGLVVGLRATEGPRRCMVAAQWLLAVGIGQGVLGYAQYFTGVPWLAVLVHVLGATLVWILAIVVLLRTRSRAAVPGDSPAQSADERVAVGD